VSDRGGAGGQPAAVPAAEAPLPPIPLRALIPNAITVLALCAGLTGVRFAIGGDFEKAAAAVVIAGVLDGIDGRVARLLKGTSRFGAELDSLSDVTAFGIAPALILFLWSLQDLGRGGWIVALFFAVCCALRLARFNASLDLEDAPLKRLGFLTGVPAPAGAGLALSPLFLVLALEHSFGLSPEVRASAVALTTALAGLAMVSTIPTWGWKWVTVPRRARLLALALVAVFAAALATAPWATLTALALAYVAAMPLAMLRFARLRALERRALGVGGQHPAAAEAAAGAAPAAASPEPVAAAPGGSAGRREGPAPECEQAEAANREPQAAPGPAAGTALSARRAGGAVRG
jgi:CDP-diacylglycerol--serine O-phosphatidyltransferase